MKLSSRALITIPLLATLISGTAHAQGGLFISEYLANPTGNDLALEYVELIATKTINFATTPYSVVFTNNGIATSAGWVAGGGVTYGFNISSGTVNRGDVVYVGGSSLNPGTGAPVIVRGINVTTTNGDSFGNLSATAGVLGNGGANADSIGVFATSAGALTNSTVPIDAVFFGTSIGTALVSGGNAGYQLPVNDKYVGGKLQSTSFVAPDPTSGNFTRATGTYNTNTNSWVTPRTFALSTAAQNAGVSTVDLVVPEPGTLALAGLGLLGLALRRRK